MKYLSHYTEKAQTDAFNKFGAFFAFSNKQFDEAKQYGVKYSSMGAGLIVPVYNVANLMHALDSIQQAGMNADIAENGIKAIIHRELENYECQITGDYSDVIDTLAPYGITSDQIRLEWGAFFDYCVHNNYS